MTRINGMEDQLGGRGVLWEVEAAELLGQRNSGAMVLPSMAQRPARWWCWTADEPAAASSCAQGRWLGRTIRGGGRAAAARPDPVSGGLAGASGGEGSRG